MKKFNSNLENLSSQNQIGRCQNSGQWNFQWNIISDGFPRQKWNPLSAFIVGEPKWWPRSEQRNQQNNTAFQIGIIAATRYLFNYRLKFINWFNLHLSITVPSRWQIAFIDGLFAIFVMKATNSEFWRFENWAMRIFT